MAEERFFEQLELGARELFRIFVPGAYAIGLATILDPTPYTHVLTESTISAFASAFFIGLAGYALRAHERWFPYFLYFEQQRATLNNEIVRITGGDKETDNVGPYKYFLETSTKGINDRIHYFSSFYYMLVELSLFSALAAYTALAHAVFPAAHHDVPTEFWIGICLLAIASIAQLVVLFGLTGVRTSRTRFVLVGEVIFVILSLIVPAVALLFHKPASIHLECGSDLVPLGLIIVSYLFWRLGEKHWKQIIGEQLVLVNVKADELRECAKKFPGPPARMA